MKNLEKRKLLRQGVIKTNIKRLRFKKNLRQVDLAIALNMNRTYISKLENARYIPDTITIINLCSVLECQIGDLYYIDWVEEGGTR